jgi:hypothetical protein
MELIYYPRIKAFLALLQVKPNKVENAFKGLGI